MGCFLSSSNHLVTTINNDNCSAANGTRNQSKENVKVLFLGPEEAGKSTLFKQLKLIYGDPYTDTERRDHIAIIHFNILMEMKQLIEKLHSLQLDDQIVAKREFQFLRFVDEYVMIDEKVGGALLIVWRDPAMKLLLERLDNSFNEVILYYLDKLEEIMILKYLPSNEDILHCRARTAGIVHAEYKLSDRILEVFDVGGHPLRWIHCFEDVSAICFVVPLNLYNVQKESQNALMITLQLFEEVCRISMFEQVPILLVFNKYDLFSKKSNMFLLTQSVLCLTMITLLRMRMTVRMKT